MDMSWKVNMLSHIVGIKDSIELNAESRISISVYRYESVYVDRQIMT